MNFVGKAEGWERAHHIILFAVLLLIWLPFLSVRVSAAHNTHPSSVTFAIRPSPIEQLGADPGLENSLLSNEQATAAQSALPPLQQPSLIYLPVSQQKIQPLEERMRLLGPWLIS